MIRVVSNRFATWHCVLIALVCGSWLLTGTALGQDAEAPPPKADAAPTLRDAPPQDLDAIPAERSDSAPRRNWVYYLQHSSADSIAQTVTAILGAQKGLSVATDKRLNAVLVSATPENQKLIGNLIKHLDREAAGAAADAKPDPPQHLEVYQLQYAEAGSLLETVGQVLGDGEGESARVAADQKRNSVIVLGSEAVHERVKGLLEKLDRPATDDQATSVTKVFALGAANPELVLAVLETLMESKDVKLAVDARAGSLIVMAPPEEMKVIEATVSQLDIEPDAEKQIKVFTIVNGDAAKLAMTLSVLLGQEEDVKFGHDERTNSIIASGSSAALNIAEAILLRLDDARESVKKPDPPEAYQVRIVWLVGGMPDDDLPGIPADLGDVVKELEKVGVDVSDQVGQALVNTTLDGRFQIECSPQLDGKPVDLKISGGLAENRDTVGLTIDISAAQAVELATNDPRRGRAEQRELANLSTVITAPLGHYVVLGVTPMGKATSVFVVQVTPKLP